jgi:hypothetical protein
MLDACSLHASVAGPGFYPPVGEGQKSKSASAANPKTARDAAKKNVTNTVVAMNTNASTAKTRFTRKDPGRSFVLLNAGKPQAEAGL